MKKSLKDKELYWEKISKGWIWMFVICIGCVLLSKFILRSHLIMYIFFMTGITSLLLYLVTSIFYHRYFIASRIAQGQSKQQAQNEWDKKYPPSAN